MDRLGALRLFVRAVEGGSITGAGRDLGMSSTAASRTMQLLEAELGVRLLNRSTRQVGATEAGRHLYRRVNGLVADLDVALQEAGDLHDNPAGPVRVTARRSFALTHVVPLLPEFREAYPRIDISLTLTEVVDLVPNEETDVAIRVGLPDRKTLVAHELVRHRSLLCASPAYLERNGEPVAPGDLSRHACLGYRNELEPPRWLFDLDGKTTEVSVSGPLVSNSGEALRIAAVEGLGFVVLPRWLVLRDIEAGALVPCLRSYRVNTAGFSPTFYAVHARSAYVPAKIKVFVDFLVDRIGRRTA